MSGFWIAISIVASLLTTQDEGSGGDDGAPEGEE